MDKELKRYIADHLAKGISLGQLKQHFITHGWSSQAVENAFASYMAPTPPSSQEPVRTSALKMTVLHAAAAVAWVTLSTILTLHLNLLVGILIIFLSIFLVPLTVILLAKKYRLITHATRVVIVSYIGSGIFYMVFAAAPALVALAGALLSLYAAYYLQIDGLRKSDARRNKRVPSHAQPS